MRIKIISIFVVFVLASSLLRAQNLTLTHEGTDVSNSEITINGSPSEAEIKVIVNITNNSESVIDVKAKKNVRSDIEGAYNTFCLGSCFSPDVTESPDPFTIGAGETTGANDFYVQFYPEGNSGEAKIIYEIYNVNDVDDKVDITINYSITPTNIQFSGYSKPKLTAYPNPAFGPSINITYQLPSKPEQSKLCVFNMLGNLVYEEAITQKSGKIILDISSYTRGIYFYSIEHNGVKIATKKLLVKN